MIEAETLVRLAPWGVQAAILLFCAFIQSTVGFAFSLFSNALLLLSGLALPETVMLSMLGSAFQRLLMGSSLRQHVNWREILPLSAISAAGLPVGIWLLWLVSKQSLAFAKVAIGTLLLVVLLVQWVKKTPRRQIVARGWGVLAAACSGVLTGFANIGGPPLLLWTHAHDWPNEKTRVMVPMITLVLVPVQLALMLATFGFAVLPTAGQALMLAPAIFLGTAAGLTVGKRLSAPRLRNAAFSLLVVTCLVCMLDPLLR
ncbi:MAG: sulfite exporter TauE/SafE family protein [candidate division WS1 bacterium]|nr:sulfite exporter TauE/SafE family protein [candidate division WS1 bacterium]